MEKIYEKELLLTIKEIRSLKSKLSLLRQYDVPTKDKEKVALALKLLYLEIKEFLGVKRLR